MAQQLKIPWQYVSGHGGPYQQPYLSRQSCEHHSRPLPARDLAKQPHTRAETVASPPGERRVGSGKRSRGAVAVKQETSERGSEGKSGSGAPSSTPHAPRKKRSVLELLPRGEASSLLLLPSTHDLLKKHNYIDPGKLKTVLKESNVVRSEGVRCEGVRAVKGEGERGTKRKEKKKVAVVRKQAWNDDQQKTSDEREKQVKSVQPFRRTVSAAPPDGVPLLDLSKLNEPDHAMKPVVLLSIEEDSENDTTRSCMSWGVPYSRTPDLVRKEKEDETERVREEEEEEEEMVVEMEGGVSEGGDRQLDVTQAKFVEEKVLSHERAISSLSPHPPQAPPSLRPPGHAPQQALQSHLTFGSGMSESGLTRRLQFEARVLSHNGRDTHRELCGFYFLSDNSITVYEFRKFGKKSSALPLVQRKVYCHQLGHKKGEPYQINYIRRGFTLHFPTSLLPSLPDYMTCHPLLSLRITQCSEREKRQLLCAHHKPTDCISIDSFLHNPLSHTEQQAWAELRTLQSGVRDQIVGRARKALVGLGRYLADHAPSDYSVGKGLMKTAVHAYHIYIDNQELNRFWRILTSLGEFSGEVEVGGCEGVRGDRVIAGLVGEMNEERKAIVRKVFQKLDTGKNGNVTLTSIRRFYRHDSSEMEGVWFDHIHKTPLHTAMTTINYADFENFYEGVSIETERDFDFISDLRRCWAL